MPDTVNEKSWHTILASAKNIQFTDTILKAELLELCKLHKPAPVYRVDLVLKSAGHTAIRLPPYHADLNPIEMIWANLKSYVGRRNLHFRKTSVETLIEEGIENIGEREWSVCCKHVREILNYRAGMLEERHCGGGRDRPSHHIRRLRQWRQWQWGTETASEGENQPTRLMKPNCFCNANLKLWNADCCNEFTKIWKWWNKRMHK